MPTGGSARPVAEAAERGARLIVSPETGFGASWDPRREHWFRQACALARRHGVLLIVGYFDRRSNDNRILFLDDRGTLAGTPDRLPHAVRPSSSAACWVPTSGATRATRDPPTAVYPANATHSIDSAR